MFLNFAKEVSSDSENATSIPAFAAGIPTPCCFVVPRSVWDARIMSLKISCQVNLLVSTHFGWS